MQAADKIVLFGAAAWGLCYNVAATALEWCEAAGEDFSAPETAVTKLPMTLVAGVGIAMLDWAYRHRCVDKALVLVPPLLGCAYMAGRAEDNLTEHFRQQHIITQPVTAPDSTKPYVPTDPESTVWLRPATLDDGRQTNFILQPGV